MASNKGNAGGAGKAVKAGALKNGELFTFVRGAKHRWRAMHMTRTGQIFVASTQECNFKSVPAGRTVYTA